MVVEEQKVQKSPFHYLEVQVKNEQSGERKQIDLVMLEE